jgi:LmbE family N-acetylglucosaminyl deacetylase
VTILGLPTGATALVVAAHPDDETLGAGGTLARLTSVGVAVHVLAIACPPAQASAQPPGSDTSAARRTKEFNTACDILGVAERLIAWSDGEPAQAPGTYPRALVGLIEHGTKLSLAELRPDLLLIPAATGVHQDHQAVHRAGFAAARPGGSARPAPRLVLGYAGAEDAWTTATEPWRAHVDTTGTWPVKQAALNAYGSQLRDPSHPRSITRIQARDIASGGLIGVGMAEDFVPYRLAL